MKTKKFPWVTLYCLLLCLFTVYVVLDTFVLVKTLSPEIGTPSATEQNGNEQTDSPFAPVITDSMYRDENILITVTEYRYEDSNVYVADVVLSSPEYLKTAFARDIFGRNIAEETSVIAEANSAILAVNGVPAVGNIDSFPVCGHCGRDLAHSLGKCPICIQADNFSHSK